MVKKYYLITLWVIMGILMLSCSTLELPQLSNSSELQLTEEKESRTSFDEVNETEDDNLIVPSVGYRLTRQQMNALYLKPAEIDVTQLLHYSSEQLDSLENYIRTQYGQYIVSIDNESVYQQVDSILTQTYGVGGIRRLNNFLYNYVQNGGGDEVFNSLMLSSSNLTYNIFVSTTIFADNFIIPFVPYSNSSEDNSELEEDLSDCINAMVVSFLQLGICADLTASILASLACPPLASLIFFTTDIITVMAIVREYQDCVNRVNGGS